ncbi:putative ribonuclease H-like domain-containing protein [Tanacetum coccineum]
MQENNQKIKERTASSSLSTASTTDNTARLSDAIIYAFLANQPNGSQVVHEDLEQIHEDDLEEMDLKWQLALLSMKARKFYQRTGKKIIINGSDTAGYDKTKVECFNCHKMGHFARECRNPRSQENRSRNQDIIKEERVNIQRIELNKSEFDLANYKRGLASVEEQLVFYKKNKERLKKEKESNQIKIDNFENASKSLDKLIGCQISDNNRKGVGYNVVAPPPTGLFAPPTIDLSNSGLEEFKQPEFEGYGVKDETLEKVSESANVQKPKQADQPRKISQNPRNNSTNWNTPMSKKLGVGISGLPSKSLGTSQREVKPVWNNAMRTNHQNFSNSRRNFAPTTVLTKSGLVPISTARQSSSRAATSVSTVKPIKTAAPKSFVNVAKTRPNAFQKLHSPSRRPFYQQTTLKNRNLNNKVNTVKVNSVNTAKGKRVTSAVGEQGINVVKSKACWVWRPKIKVLDHVSKNNGSYICKQFDYVDPTGLEFKVIDYKGYAEFDEYAELKEDIDDSMNVLSVLVVYHTTNGHQFTMSNRQERIGYSRANDNWISKIDCLLSSEVLFRRPQDVYYALNLGPLDKGLVSKAVHKELGDSMKWLSLHALSFEASRQCETMVFHNEDGNPARANIKQAIGYLKDGDGDGNSQPHKGVKASANSDVMYFFTSAQDGDPSRDDVRLCLGDDLKKA